MSRFRTNPSRRDFLRNVLAAIAALILPKRLLTREIPSTFWFVPAASGAAWPVADPVRWSLKNARQPILEPAAEGLLQLTPADGDRIIRLVIRRCHLNLLELHHGQVVVHYWGELGMVDLRLFFKTHEVTHPDIEVVLKNRKKESVTTRPGDDFLYGDRSGPAERFLDKWERRFEREADDQMAAPWTRSGYAWEGVASNEIPWSALKSAWRRTVPLLCLNCDQPTILSNFGNPQCSFFNRSLRFIHVCGACRRSFRDESIKDVRTWMAANLDSEVWPDFYMVGNRQMKWGPKA